MNKVEKLATQYQEKVLPFVAHLETKERNAVLKNIEKGKEDNLVVEWKQALVEKGLNPEEIAKEYLSFVKESSELEDEDAKKLKNKNTYFLRKNVDALKEKFEALVVETVEIKVEVKKEVVEVVETVKVEGHTYTSLLKGKKHKKSTKEKRQNKNVNRVKKQRNKKRLAK